MHFHQYVLSCVGLAIHIIDETAVFVPFTQALLVEKLQVGDMSFTFKQVVKEVYEKRLRDFLSENHFEPHIGERIDKLSHICHFYLQIYIINLNYKQVEQYFFVGNRGFSL